MGGMGVDVRVGIVMMRTIASACPRRHCQKYGCWPVWVMTPVSGLAKTVSEIGFDRDSLDDRHFARFDHHTWSSPRLSWPPDADTCGSNRQQQAAAPHQTRRARRPRLPGCQDGPGPCGQFLHRPPAFALECAYISTCSTGRRNERGMTTALLA